jgi:hypothetical protein
VPLSHGASVPAVKWSSLVPGQPGLIMIRAPATRSHCQAERVAVTRMSVTLAVTVAWPGPGAVTVRVTVPGLRLGLSRDSDSEESEHAVTSRLRPVPESRSVTVLRLGSLRLGTS